jgi:hypothetical protein
MKHWLKGLARLAVQERARELESLGHHTTLSKARE